MDTRSTLEQVCAAAWPPVVARTLGDWRLRASGGYTGRANSALTNGDPGLPVNAALAEITRFAGEHGIRPYAQVISGSSWESPLAAAGWRVNADHPKGAESAVMHSPLTSTGGGADVADKPPNGWLEVAVRGTPTDTQRAVVTGGPLLGYATVHRDGRVVGTARGCLVGAWLYVALLEVLPEYRRQGIATHLLDGLDTWAAARGATSRVLQVALVNEVARGIYADLGYVESHRYRYWAP
ncbi:GNAT family N-acetyltransferase [Actinokineospora auranticolor]|uniref:Acetyltransferase (GNAT) family protein n=1 Tax=Actinokineospora auranticolor TaxID=155976 RepID=A0A2S6GYB1_9PSEU|nr:GNAT family N-acetyltransferase [Actinokineospora auranticolor]PPK70166.1 acetyltransferase (GNAT) family protein [Actinokineospora auranticolor]